MNPELDKIDRRILFELDQNCRIPETRLAKLVGKSKEAVRYRIKNLKESGVIRGYSAHINMGQLGYKGYKIYLKIREKPLLKRKFLEHLKSRNDIYWIGVGDGAWSIAVTFLAKTNDEFYLKKNELYAQYRDIVVSEVNGIMVEGTVFGKKFLLGEEPLPAKPVIVFGRAQIVSQIDDVEKKILGAMLHNSRIKLVELAQVCDTSIEVVRNRIRRMEAQGIIQRYQVDMDFQKLGMEFYKTFLYLEGLSPKMQKRIDEMSRRHPHIINYVKVIAPWAIELEIMVENYQKYNEVINQIRREFADVLINIESTNMNEDVFFPAKKTIFEE